MDMNLAVCGYVPSLCCH